jgi:hypothetical protein
LLKKYEEAQAYLSSYPGVINVELMPGNQQEGRIRLEIEFIGDDQALSSLLDGLVHNNIPVLHLSEESRDMEEIFMRATKGLVT